LLWGLIVEYTFIVVWTTSLLLVHSCRVDSLDYLCCY